MPWPCWSPQSETEEKEKMGNFALGYCVSLSDMA
jgi:hypothetical protein